MKRSDLRQWAAMGARQRLVEIANEQRAIFEAFPELRGGGRSARPAFGDAGELQPTKRKRHRFRMSAEARKRISDAQKARWAKQRVEGSNPGSAVKSASHKKR